MKDLYVGIDLGGTFIKCGVLNKNGEVLAKTQSPTEKEKGVKGVLLNVVLTMRETLKKIGKSEEDVKAMGFGVPGIVNDDYQVIEATNIGWTKVDAVQELKAFTNIPVHIGNDANVAALGEAKFGVGKGMKDVFLITLGTGVGSGYVINGEIFAGNMGCGAEIGHAILVKNGNSCNCGQKGCVEAYLSATAIVKAAKRAMSRNKESLLWSVAGGKDALTAKDVFELSNKDAAANKVYTEYLTHLYDLCLNLANAFRPQAIVLGGGVSLAGELLTKPVQEKLDENIFAKDLTPKVQILAASLGNDAGFIGAAVLAMNAQAKKEKSI